MLQIYFFDPDRVSTFSNDSYHMIQAYSHSKELETLVQTLSTQQKGEPINMCKATTALIAKGKEEGRLEGRLEAKRELVRSMYANGVDCNHIMQIATLTEIELAVLLEEE